MGNNRALSDNRFELFREMLKCNQLGLKNSLREFLPTLYGEENIISTKEYLIALGTIPVGLVSHLDTVHKVPVKDLFYDRESNVMWSPQGLGADDRAGVYSILEIIGKGYRPTVIFTTDEEIGGIGAAKLASELSSINFNVEPNFLVELDRRGAEDCVFYECDNSAFEKYIEDFGFSNNFGSFSDISFLCPAWGIAGVNLSIGYYNEHSLSEYLRVDEMLATVDKVCNILDTVTEDDKFLFIPAEYSGIDWSNSKDGLGYDESWWRESRGNYKYDTTKVWCWNCLESFEDEFMIKVGKDSHYCGDCYAKIFTTCIDCGEAFKDRHRVHLKCEKCRGE